MIGQKESFYDPNPWWMVVDSRGKLWRALQGGDVLIGNHVSAILTTPTPHILAQKILVWLPLQSLAVKKKTFFFFVQILGGEKLLKFGEKWAVKNF